MRAFNILAIFIILSVLSCASALADQYDYTYQLYMKSIGEGLQYLQDNQYEDAINSFWEAIYALPEKPDAYINMASVYLERSEPETAMRFLIRAKDAMPAGYVKENILLYNLGLCSYMLGNYHSAIDYYSQAFGVSVDFGEAAYGLGLSYLKTNQPQKSFDSITKAKEIFLRSGQMDFVRRADDTLAVIKRDYGIPAEPVKIVEEIIKPVPGDAQSYYKKGIGYLKYENYSQAIEHFREALKIDPTFTKAYINLGSTYGKMGRYKEALREYKRATKYDKTNPKIYYNIAMVYVATGNERKAHHYLQKAKELCLESGDMDLLGKIDKWL